MNSDMEALPDHACDCHTHVFGPYDEFPVSHRMHYEAPLATAAMHAQMLAEAGLSRGVLVQPGANGVDAAPIIAALKGSAGRLRGVAAAEANVSDATLDAWHAAGICGLRFNEMQVPGSTGRFAGSVGFGDLEALAPRLRSRGWHAEIWATIDQNAALLSRYRSWGIPVCLDHMAGLDASRGLDDPSFRAVLAALREGWLWIKLVPTRCSQDFPDYSDLAIFHGAFAEACPERLVWGSDWPHLRLGAKTPRVPHLLSLFANWISDAPTMQRVLVDNPIELYGF
jgi:predicted TIM-barrel fold metal-dependent hydrolase